MLAASNECIRSFDSHSHSLQRRDLIECVRSRLVSISRAFILRVLYTLTRVPVTCGCSSAGRLIHYLPPPVQIMQPIASREDISLAQLRLRQRQSLPADSGNLVASEAADNNASLASERSAAASSALSDSNGSNQHWRNNISSAVHGSQASERPLAIGGVSARPNRPNRSRRASCAPRRTQWETRAEVILAPPARGTNRQRDSEEAPAVVRALLRAGRVE